MVLGLDGKEKMSKQLGNHIELALSDEETEKKVMAAVTDPARRYRRDPGHPEVCNVYRLHGFFNLNDLDDIAIQCRQAAIGCVECKKILANSINNTLQPFREQRAIIATKPEYIMDVINDGAKRARTIARETLREVKQKMKLV